MIDLKDVVLMLLNGDEVIITDDLDNRYEVKLEMIPSGVALTSETTLIIRSVQLRD